MIDEPHSLESELKSWQAAPVSPALRDRVARRLDDESPGLRRVGRRRWALGIVVGVAAAGTVAAIVLFPRDGSREPRPTEEEIVWPVDVTPPGVEPDESTEFPPTLGDYRRALARSPEELEAFFNRRTAPVAPPPGEPLRVRTLHERLAADLNHVPNEEDW